MTTVSVAAPRPLRTEERSSSHAIGLYDPAGEHTCLPLLGIDLELQAARYPSLQSYLDEELCGIEDHAKASSLV